MEHNSKKPFTWKAFVRDNGYYMVLALCVVAVGVSGILLMNTVNEPLTPVAGESLSVPLTPEDEAAEKPGEQTAPTVTQLPDVPKAEEEKPVEKTVAPVEGTVVAVFSVDALTYNETTRDWRTHNGVDLSANLEDPVVAAQKGTVTAVFYDNALGQTVVLNHGDGLESRYSNLAESVPVEVGDSLAVGEVLGYVGATANSEMAEEPHVHFAVYQDNKLVDPEAMLPD